MTTKVAELATERTCRAVAESHARRMEVEYEDGTIVDMTNWPSRIESAITPRPSVVQWQGKMLAIFLMQVETAVDAAAKIAEADLIRFWCSSRVLL